MQTLFLTVQTLDISSPFSLHVVLKLRVNRIHKMPEATDSCCRLETTREKFQPMRLRISTLANVAKFLPNVTADIQCTWNMIRNVMWYHSPL